jgi:hypothetical protein
MPRRDDQASVDASNNETATITHSEDRAQRIILHAVEHHL